MAKKKAIYAPGELDRIRGKLGDIDPEEAQRIASLLGGEVGTERAPGEDAPRNRPRRVYPETAEVVVGGGGASRKPRRRVETMANDEDTFSVSKQVPPRETADSMDNSAIPIRVSYWERIKMDKYSGRIEFEIMSPRQVFVSMLSIFGAGPDLVSPVLTNRRMNDYYKRIEILVISVRTLLPRNNLQRNERLKKAVPLVFAILDTLRYWNIEALAGNLSKVQSHSRAVKTGDFSDLLRDIYRPLYVLEQLNP
jgi:hypothetical protein